MKINIPWLGSLLFIIIFSSCRYDNATPIRNVRFDPGLLNPIKAAGGSCINQTYYYKDEQKDLGLVYTRKILVAFTDDLSIEQISEATQRHGFVQSLGQAVHSNSARLYPIQLVDGLNCQQAEAAIAQMAKDPAVSYAAPFFETGDGQLLGISNEFIVTVEAGRQPANDVLNRLANATGTELITALSEDTFVLRADKNSRGNALEMANFFHKQPLVKHAEPDFVVSLPL
ncbi:hypothetical protein [uncultured Pontibacter sp.]|uniref:hypothetical protein n=1 Tax=uncultured Pontibacter sp. TaxID=453356 RepID=UPI0026263DD1|nr:hypothetical protein [uncultured Pontibacter sp.]